MKRSAFVTIAAAAALALTFFAGNTIAGSSRFAPTPPLVATVNIQKIFDSLTERKDKFDQLQNEAARLEGEFNAINRNIATERDTVSKMAEGPAKDAAMEVVIDKDVQANINIKKAKARLEKAQADAIRAISEKIQKAAAAYAAPNGYSMVMAADDWVTISTRATAQEATQVMSMRRFLYVDNTKHDITAALLKNLNDDYAATKPATPAPATTAPVAPAPTPAPAATTPPAAPTTGTPVGTTPSAPR